MYEMTQCPVTGVWTVECDGRVIYMGVEDEARELLASLTWVSMPVRDDLDGLGDRL